LSPDVFDADDQGHSVVIAGELDEAQLASAQAAVSNCQEQAISLVD